MEKINELVAMVETLEQLKPGEYSSNEIRVVIAMAGEDGKPRNWSHRYEEPKNSTGGCFARIYASGSSYNKPRGLEANYFSSYGPNIDYGSSEQYRHALKATELVAKRMEKHYETRGNPVDSAESIGRWIESCGVSRVFVRPAGESNHGWLNRGEWRVLTIGQLVTEVRALLYVTPDDVVSVEGGSK